jgi:hypothetical protein
MGILTQVFESKRVNKTLNLFKALCFLVTNYLIAHN